VNDSLNHVVLTGEIVERQTLRYTPGAIAVLDMKLQHEGMIEQAGASRTVKFEIAVVAMGDLALMWQSATLGQKLKVDGFLASARQNSPRMVIHAQSIAVSSNV